MRRDHLRDLVANVERAHAALALFAVELGDIEGSCYSLELGVRIADPFKVGGRAYGALHVEPHVARRLLGETPRLRVSVSAGFAHVYGLRHGLVITCMFTKAEIARSPALQEWTTRAASTEEGGIVCGWPADELAAADAVPA